MRWQNECQKKAIEESYRMDTFMRNSFLKVNHPTYRKFLSWETTKQG